MDPYFHLPRAVRPKVRQGLSEWASRNALGGFFSDAFDRLKYIRLVLRRKAPPKSANLHLLTRWRRLAASGLPILVLRAPGPKAAGAKPRVGEFDYFRYVEQLAGRRSRVVFRFIEGTNHSFADLPGRTAVQQTVQRWLNTFFPLETCQDAALGARALEKTVII